MVKTAREKLNSVYIFGCVIVAAFLGLICESWLVFGLALIVAIGACESSGGIREKRRPRAPLHPGTRPPRKGR